MTVTSAARGGANVTDADTTPRRELTPTALLGAWSRGNPAAFDHLVSLVHDELRRIATRIVRRERAAHSLPATALVNEAYLRLTCISRIHWRDRRHFFAMSARVMRRVLVDAARARRSAKRDVSRVPFDESRLAPPPVRRDLVAIDHALRTLQTAHPRQGQVVELRFFGGFHLQDVAMVLNVSVDTVKRDYRFAKLWLLRELRQERPR
jgi:RNA polymerase sigma-70 factor (ECF subfamily)